MTCDAVGVSPGLEAMAVCWWERLKQDRHEEVNKLGQGALDHLKKKREVDDGDKLNEYLPLPMFDAVPSKAQHAATEAICETTSVSPRCEESQYRLGTVSSSRHTDAPSWQIVLVT